jgi:hypothetical protein
MSDVNLSEFKKKEGESSLKKIAKQISLNGLMNLIKENIPQDQIPSHLYRAKDKQILVDFLVQNV